MSHVPGLRSPYETVGRLMYFGRMLDKIRLHVAGKLPPDYIENYGETQPNVFDSRCCRFLGVPHAEIVKQVVAGQSDEQLLAWCHATGGARTDEQCEIWNMFMTKRGWRDPSRERLYMRMRESGFTGRTDIETFFDYIDADEGRDPARTRPF